MDPWYGPEGEGNAEADLAACFNRQALPICLVAFDESNQMVGTASLKDDSVGSKHGVGPWLAGLLVGGAYRGAGVGTALVAAIENEAGRSELDEKFCSADSSAGILERRGWQSFATTESLRRTISVYRKSGLTSLAAATPSGPTG